MNFRPQDGREEILALAGRERQRTYFTESDVVRGEPFKLDAQKLILRRF